MAGFPGYRVDILAGGEVLASDVNTLAITEGTFATSTVTFNSTADHPQIGQNLEIHLVNLANGPGLEVDFDNVRLDAAPTNGIAGDFNSDGQISSADVDILYLAVDGQAEDSKFDLNLDGNANHDDAIYWVKEIANTWVGDSDINGEFDSGDLVNVFSAGQYEDAIPLNSHWSTGDWNGDREFDTADLVAAFKDGGYEAGPLTATVPVPEPSCAPLAVLSILLLAGPSRLQFPPVADVF